ncbi:MAG: alpha/beta hydrolase [Desulfobacterales bacterium]|nr:alpha/beta hydrolase [Desulfobacterales bacterium]
MKSHLRFVNYGLAIIIFYIAFITSSYNLNIPFEQNAFASSSIGLSELKLYKGRVESTLWGPIEGAKVTAGAGWDIYSDITKKDGSYVTAYRFRGCPFFTYIAQVPVFIEMFYANFNPKTNFIGTFAETFYALDFCCGGDYTYLIGLEGGYGYAKECWDLEDEMTQKLAGIGYISVINVAILSGTATMDNVPREGIKYELSGPIPFVDKGKTEYQYDQIGLNHDIADRGLVKQISREDLEKTDICVYNLNDELITERQGIISKLEIKGEEKNASIYYNMYLRGPLTDSTEKVQNSAIGAFSDINDKDWNIYKHLKWDKIKIVAINRATGYIGTTICDINKDRNGSINIKPSQIFMRPPKLLISGVRIPKLESTLSKQVPKPYIIGFEGAGLTSDQTIAIRTYWNEDWNGNPLPKNLSGFTGRLAKVIAPNTLGKVSGKIEIAKGFEAGQIGQFEIKTGIHTQLVRLPEKEISKSHYYIHVNGEPPDRKPDFSSVGAGTGPLQYRPKHYVPIQVSVHDLSKGDEYIGVYRPEMQFSVFDLKEVTYEDKSGKKYDLIQPLPEKPILGEDFNFFYTILKDELPVLNPFGSTRKLVFAIGEKEIEVEYDENKGLKFNLDDIGKFSTEDYLALKLYQRGDENNLLWEYALLTVDVDIDSDNDDETAVNFERNEEEDKLEEDETKVGKIIQVNNQDADGNGVPDFADFFINVATKTGKAFFTPIKLEIPGTFDLNKIKIKFDFSESDPNNIQKEGEGTPSKPFIYTPSPGNLRIWKRDGNLSRIKTEVNAGGERIKPGTEYSTNELGFSRNRDVTLYVEGINPSSSKGDQRISVEMLYYGDRITPIAIAKDRIRTTIINAELIPDWNRDGVIDDLDKNHVTKKTPWRFWINSDNDGLSGNDGIGGSENDRTGSGNEGLDNHVNGVRDLIDFFPLALDFSNVIKVIPSNESLTYSLKLSEPKGMLNYFEGVYNNGLITPSNVRDYLVNLDVAYSFSNKAVKTINAIGKEFSTSLLNPLSSLLTEIIFIEAPIAFSGDIELIIKKAGKKIANFSFPVEISEVEKMFKHKDFRNQTGATDGKADRPEASNRPYCMNQEDKTLVWVHGYNVSADAAEGSFAEIFKRFFHIGYNGGFYGISWYGDPPALGSNAGSAPHYHQTVVNSFYAAELMADFVNRIGGNIHIAGHSMGNMVIGLAIQRHGLNFNKYFAIDAAVPLEAYGQTAVRLNMINFNENEARNWQDYWVYRENDIYPAQKVLPSQWHTLFDASDYRSTLTWRNQLVEVTKKIGEVYNFYSNTEDVLREYSESDFLWDGAGKKLQMYSWVKQEKFKGRRDKVQADIGGASSNYCGWSYNMDYRKIGDRGMYINLSPNEATKISDKDLKKVPFFRLHVDQPYINELIADGNTPSEFLKKFISQTYLTKYYEYNKAVHGHVIVRDWLLAEAFPATTLPMGANELSRLQENNINMSTKCKTERILNGASDWPRKGMLDDKNRDWWHSDYKDMPYVRVSEFYKKIKTFIGE